MTAPRIVGTRTVVVGHTTIEQTCWSDGTEGTTRRGLYHTYSRGGGSYEQAVRERRDEETKALPCA